MSRRTRVPVALVTAVAAATPFLPALAGTSYAAIPTPGIPRLPSGIESPAAYVGQQFCGPEARPGVVAFRNLVLRTYPFTGSYGIVRDCSIGGRSEHKEGRAWDWKVNAANARQKAAADRMIAWLLAPDAAGHPAAMARRIGIMYIIWNGRVWKSYAPGWTPYTGAGPHADHVHFSFSWEGALKETSFFSGRVAAPRSGPPFALPRMSYPADSAAHASYASGPAFPGNVGYGATGDTVRQIQSRVGSQVSGWYGPVTVAAVKRYQAGRGIPTTGIVGPQTWGSLFGGGSSGSASVVPASSRSGAPFPGNIGYGANGATVRQIQARVGSTVSGWYGPVTVAAVKRYQAARGIPATGIVGPQTWRSLFGGGGGSGGSSGGVARAVPAVATSRSTPGASFPGNVGYGARGATVSQIQAKVGAPASGWYGPVTVQSVKAYQAKRGIPATGIVGPQTWRAMFGGGANAVVPVAATTRVGGSGSFPGNTGYGATGATVRSIQARVGAPVSGWYGPVTVQSVKAYQAKRGIAATGVVGPLTWRSLFG